MLPRVTHTGEAQYYKINYKYESCNHLKTKACRNISCSFICSFILQIFSYVAI